MSIPDDMIDDEALQDETFSQLGAAVRPLAVDAGRRRALMDRLRSRVAPPPEGTTTYRASDGGWFSSTPNVEMKMLRIDEAAGTSEMLIRLGAGVVVPGHTHRKEEQMVILEGECHLGDHLLRAGDSHVAPPGSWHPPISVLRSVLILLRSEYPLPTT